ncbi:hypothetical protein Tco_0657085 [Tanacetum coccineum]|uniref:Uncharacterized protein n=1 Tax=Tanacetum coccineum TaxID=301880 RepID=A0ABQ4XAT7_9ASTR
MLSFNYTFLASRLQSAGLQTNLLRRTDIVASGPNFDDALRVFNTSMETDFLSNPNETVAPKLMQKMMALWKSQREDHISDWLRTVSISGLGQTMNACSRVFAGDIYGDHVVSCTSVIGIKHSHNVVRDTLFDIYMLLYSWDGGLDVCVDLTGSSPLTQTGLVDFVPGRAVIDAAQRKREADTVTLLKRIQKFSMTQDIRARAAVHIFNRISFAIAKGLTTIPSSTAIISAF